MLFVGIVLAATTLVLANIDMVTYLIFNQPYTGRIRKLKQGLIIRTTDGMVRIPDVKLPNLETEIHILKTTYDGRSGMVPVSEVLEHRSHQLRTIRDRAICEILYPEDIGCNTVLHVCVMSQFEDDCLVTAVEMGEPIDYKKMLYNFCLNMES